MTIKSFSGVMVPAIPIDEEDEKIVDGLIARRMELLGQKPLTRLPYCAQCGDFHELSPSCRGDDVSDQEVE